MMHLGNHETRCRSRKGSGRDGQGGFSLPELAIVLGIIGLLIAVTTPAWQAYIENNRLAQGADSFVMKLMLARQKAVTQGNDFILTYDAGAGTFRLHDDDNNNGTFDAGEWRDVEHTLPPGVSVYYTTFTNPFVSFSRDGSASETGEIVLSNGRNNQIRIEVTGATGRVASSRI